MVMGVFREPRIQDQHPLLVQAYHFFHMLVLLYAQRFHEEKLIVFHPGLFLYVPDELTGILRVFLLYMDFQ